MAAKDIEAGRAHVLVTIRDRMTQGLKLAERKLQNFGRYVATSAGVVTAGIGAGLAWPIKLAANMEQTQTSFEVFLGSAEAARKKLAEIEQTAAETPFTFDQLKDAAQTLLQFGVSADALMPTMRNLGDVSGGDAEKFSRLSLAFGQVMAKGRLMGQEVNQMVEASFNPLTEIARTTGRTVADLSTAMENGEISSRMLAMAFQSAASAGGHFNGSMQKQSQTLIGLFSTLVDNAAMVGRAFGNAIMPALKTFVQVGISVSKFLTDFVKNNGALVATMGKVALVVGGVAAGFAAIGVAAMAGSFVVGLFASAFSAIATVVLVAFSPLGVLIGLIMGLAGAAIYFRAEIIAALSGVAAYFQPLIGSFSQLYEIFIAAFGGIIAALQSGSLESAASIAWLGFSALAWSAIADMMGAFDSLLGFLEGYLPGLSAMFDSFFAGIGTAILSGRWDLAGALAMNKLYLVMTQGMNAIAFAWDMLVTGFQTVFDTVFGSIKSAFWTTVYGLANGIAWLSEKISSLLGLQDPLQGAAEGLKQMEQQQATADQKEAFLRDQGRMQRNQTNADKRGQAETDLQDKIAKIEAEIAAASGTAGSPTVNGVAEAARKSLEDALAKAKEEQAAKAAMGTKASESSAALAGSINSAKGGGAGGKGASTGTFSAIASALGNRTNGAAESTAKNTGLLVRLAKQQLQKPAPGLAP
jgi:tape measure domain-containing protein